VDERDAPGRACAEEAAMPGRATIPVPGNMFPIREQRYHTCSQTVRGSVLSKLRRLSLLQKTTILIWSAGLLVALLLWAGSRQPVAGRTITRISGVDSVYYFATAHSLLFDRDFDLANQFARVAPDPNQWTAAPSPTGKPQSPFAVGFPLMQTPFLALGHAVALIVDGSSDTFSPRVVLFYYIGIAFWTCLGLVLLLRLLAQVLALHSADALLNERIAAGVTFLAWPATTLNYYTFSPLAHSASFAAVVLFLWTWMRAKDGDLPLRWFACGAALGLVTLCRWQDVLFAAAPLTCELAGLRGRSPSFRGWILSRGAGGVAFLAAVSPQLVQWRSLYGRWLTVPQGEGFFEFPPPHLLHVLVSTQHGWLTWTPAVALALIGCAYAARRAPRLITSLLVVVFLQVLLIGSLTYSWSGHWSFGMRFLTSLIPVLGIGLSIGLVTLGRRLRIVAALLGIACAAFTMLFAVQYRLDLIPKDDRLTLQEYLTDKVRIRSALQRRQAVREIARLVKEDRAAEAVRLAEQARERFRPDRQMLEAELTLYAATGDTHRRDAAQAELVRLMSSRLF
jgi:hypothetical protein